MESWNMEVLSDISYVKAIYKWMRHKTRKGVSKINNNEAEKNMIKNLNDLQNKYKC